MADSHNSKMVCIIIQQCRFSLVILWYIKENSTLSFCIHGSLHQTVHKIRKNLHKVQFVIPSKGLKAHVHNISRHFEEQPRRIHATSVWNNRQQGAVSAINLPFSDLRCQQGSFEEKQKCFTVTLIFTTSILPSE